MGKFAVMVVLAAGGISAVERLIRDVGEIKSEFKEFRVEIRDSLSARPSVEALNVWGREFQLRNQQLDVPEFRQYIGG
jgi:hypothetical protein